MATSPARTDRWKALRFQPADVGCRGTRSVRARRVHAGRRARGGHHAEPAARGQRDHHGRDGGAPDRDPQTIAVRPAVRAVILFAGAGSPRPSPSAATSSQRKDMTEDQGCGSARTSTGPFTPCASWHKPIFTAVNGDSLRRQLRSSPRAPTSSSHPTCLPPSVRLGDGRPRSRAARQRCSRACSRRVKAMQMLMTGDPISAQEIPARDGQRALRSRTSSSAPPTGSRRRSRSNSPTRRTGRQTAERSGWARRAS